jgi:hypothetical protein
MCDHNFIEVVDLMDVEANELRKANKQQTNMGGGGQRIMVAEREF